LKELLREKEVTRSSGALSNVSMKVTRKDFTEEKFRRPAFRIFELEKGTK